MKERGNTYKGILIRKNMRIEALMVINLLNH